MTVYAKFDGKALVPEGPLPLAAGERVRLDITPASTIEYRRPSPEQIAERLRLHDKLSGSVRAGTLPERMSRSDNFYEERE